VTEREISKLEADLASGAPWQLIKGPIETRKAQRELLVQKIAAEMGMVQVIENSNGVRADLAARLSDWGGLLRRQPVHARQILRKILAGKLVFDPFEGGCVIRGKAS